ncbi:hypothetical protein CDAR_610831 [Caerostris darwini]|uniref:Uncharacterized protein n=1 Tax=Caerostris darwini TaxID=1538125 RepID=A0AAV4Q516_9ARAC|nr:hypothetical protein CDAR_610831 [Caerostris darwini]
MNGEPSKIYESKAHRKCLRYFQMEAPQVPSGAQDIRCPLPLSRSLRRQAAAQEESVRFAGSSARDMPGTGMSLALLKYLS